MTTKRKPGAKPTLSHEDRLALIKKPLPPILNWRVVYAQKRWAGVFVDDYFGEKAGIRKRLSGRLPGMTNTDTNYDTSAEVGVVTKFDTSFLMEDYALWERIGGDDSNI